MRSLRQRILIVIVSMVLLTSVSILLVTWLNAARFAESQFSQGIENAASAFRQIMVQREQQLTNTAALLTADFGFKQTVASRDTPTLSSMLQNHGERVQADLMLLTTMSGELLASNRAGQLQAGLSFADQLRQMQQQGRMAEILELDGELYQVAMVAVRAPVPIAMAAIGFKIDREVALELKALTGMEVTFVASNHALEPISTLNKADALIALKALQSDAIGISNPFSTDAEFASREIAIEQPHSALRMIALSMPLDTLHQEFNGLRNIILLVGMGVALLGAAIAFRFSSTLSRPLNNLVNWAMSLAGGDYQKPRSEAVRVWEVDQLIKVFGNMSEQIGEREAQIVYHLEHDEETGLVNRPTLESRLQQQWIDQDRVFALVMFRVRGIREAADAFGPEIEHHLVKHIAALISRNEPGLVCRMSEYEFAVVFHSVDAQADDAHIEELSDALNQPISHEGVVVKPVSCFGVVRYPDSEGSARDLIRRGAIALQSAMQKQSRLVHYAEGEDEAYLYRLRVIQELRHAIENRDGQLHMAYLPKLDLAEPGKPGAEALIRWNHAQLGSLSPELFVSLAEQSNLVTRLTDRVLDMVVEDVQRLLNNFAGLKVSVNLAAQDLGPQGVAPSCHGASAAGRIKS